MDAHDNGPTRTHTWPLALLIAMTVGLAVNAEGAGFGVEIGPGGYLVADNDRIFDDIGEEGLTIEVWFHVNNVDVDKRYVIFAKPGAYWMELRGNTFADRIWIDDPAGRMPFSGGVWGFAPRDMPEWLHLIWHVYEEDGWIKEWKTIDSWGLEMASVGSALNPGTLVRSPHPLTFGGVDDVGRALDPFAADDFKGRPASSLDGIIDDIRISRGLPVPAWSPNWREKTIAAWALRGSSPYEDADNASDHVLTPHGAVERWSPESLSVDPQAKAATTWASLKRRP